MAEAEIPRRPPPPTHLVKGSAGMRPAVLGWKNCELSRGSKISLGMERPIGGVLVTSGIIFMMGCIRSMILEMAIKHGMQSSTKRMLAVRNRLLPPPAHQLNPQRVLLTGANSDYPKKKRLRWWMNWNFLRTRWIAWCLPTIRIFICPRDTEYCKMVELIGFIYFYILIPNGPNFL